LLTTLSWQPETPISRVVAPPTASIAPRATPQPTKPPRAVLRGLASFYDWHSGEAAAGPALRAFLGPKWRGQRVRVCASRCLSLVISDWCQCLRGKPDERIIDLARSDFALLAPLSQGLVRVTIQ